MPHDDLTELLGRDRRVDASFDCPDCHMHTAGAFALRLDDRVQTRCSWCGRPVVLADAV